MASALIADRLGKTYRMYTRPIDRLRELLLANRVRFHQAFEALCDVSFEVGHGSTLGVVGSSIVESPALCAAITSSVAVRAMRVAMTPSRPVGRWPGLPVSNALRNSWYMPWKFFSEAPG